MHYFLSKIRQSIFGQGLLLFLITFMISPPLMAQQQRRGMFLQDGTSVRERGRSFRQLDLDEREDELLGQDSLLDSSEGAQSLLGRRGLRGSSLVYQVHVLGEVRRPGTYRVSPSMRVTDALKLAGGIENRGSERFVRLRKSGNRRGRHLDLFAYKTLGQLAQNPYLEDNITIFVPLKKKAVEIEGPVRRPGIYELKNERNLQDLLDLAGGFSVGATQEHPIKVVRYLGYEKKEIIEIPNDPHQRRQFLLQDGDVAVVQHKFLTKHKFDYNLRKLPNDNIFYPAYEDKVFVIGGVKRPGAFDFNQYYSVRQYLTLAGGTTVMAKRGKIRIVTADGKTVKTPKGKYEGLVNPGDTIVIPERTIPPQFYINLLTTMASLGLSSYAILRN